MGGPGKFPKIVILFRGWGDPSVGGVLNFSCQRRGGGDVVGGGLYLRINIAFRGSDV